MANKQDGTETTWSMGKWCLWALIGVLILYLLMLWFKWDPIEKDIQARTTTALQKAGLSWATVDLDRRGRDVLLTGTPPGDEARQLAVHTAEAVYGVRIVETDFGDFQPLTPPSLTLKMDGKAILLEGSLPSVEDVDRIVALANAQFGEENVSSRLQVSTGISQVAWHDGLATIMQSFQNISDTEFSITGSGIILKGSTGSEADKSSIGALIQSALKTAIDNQLQVKIVAEPKPVRTAVQVEAINRCQEELNQTIEGKKIEFVTNSSEINETSYPLLGSVIAIIKKCEADIGDTIIEISGHTDNTGNEQYNQKLSTERAEKVSFYLSKHGVFEFRLKAIGYGESRPIASNDTEEGRAQNRRIQFELQ